MLALPIDLSHRYETLLQEQGIASQHRPHYVKWLRYYWDFCHKYALEPGDRKSLPAFDEKLRAVKTTMIYTHTVPSVTLKEAKSPLDF